MNDTRTWGDLQVGDTFRHYGRAWLVLAIEATEGTDVLLNVTTSTVSQQRHWIRTSTDMIGANS